MKGGHAASGNLVAGEKHVITDVAFGFQLKAKTLQDVAAFNNLFAGKNICVQKVPSGAEYALHFFVKTFRSADCKSLKRFGVPDGI